MKLIKSKILFATLIMIFVFSNCYSQQNEDYTELRLNEIQIIGSHNSYKKAIEPKLWQVINLFDSILARSLQYEHISITKQLDLGLRNLEIDVVYDPNGGKFNDPLGNKLLNIYSSVQVCYDPNNEMLKPGFKVMHQPDFDFRSHNMTFVGSLTEIKKWSDSNKGHIPIIITMNTKDKKYNIPGTVDLLPFTKEVLDAIDDEILMVFTKNDLITPDLIQGGCRTLEEAVLTKGWPTIEKLKGRVQFVIAKGAVTEGIT